MRRLVTPMRVNPIREHTDHTGGLVMPVAIQYTTVALIGLDEEKLYFFVSVVYPEVRTMGHEDRSGKVGNWSIYSVGVLRQSHALQLSRRRSCCILAGTCRSALGGALRHRWRLAARWHRSRHEGYAFVGGLIHLVPTSHGPFCDHAGTGLTRAAARDRKSGVRICRSTRAVLVTTESWGQTLDYGGDHGLHWREFKACIWKRR
jgi:hypothetical protein